MKKVYLMLGAFSTLWLYSANSFAQFLSVPLYYGSTNAVKDERGFVLQGTVYTPGALVQIMRADFGIFPPAMDGTPHPLNPILGQTRIGMGTDPAAGDTGMFASSVSINRFVVTPMFVRVFNRFLGADASFYGDSQIYSNSVSTYGVFVARINSTCNPLDPDDHDRDRLPNSMETLLGTDSLNPDSDGDGILDGDEYLAGTNPLDNTDFLQMANVALLPDEQLYVMWQSVSGKWYQIEYSDNMMLDPVEFNDYGAPVEATESITLHAITNAYELSDTVFRVKLIVP